MDEYNYLSKLIKDWDKRLKELSKLKKLKLDIRVFAIFYFALITCMLIIFEVMRIKYISGLFISLDVGCITCFLLQIFI